MYTAFDWSLREEVQFFNIHVDVNLFVFLHKSVFLLRFFFPPSPFEDIYPAPTSGKKSLVALLRFLQYSIDEFI